MAVRSGIAVAKILLLPASLAFAGAAFVNAASEAEILSVGPGVSQRLGVDAKMAAALVDRGFRTEIASRQPASGDFPRLSDALIVNAREVFAVDPLDVPALRTIALGNVLQDDGESARQMMRLAAQLSKRDAISDLWLAQDYGRTDDVPEMVASFDNALRTNVRAREYAMKPLVDALGQENSHLPVGRLLAKNPEWERAFWAEFVRNSSALQNSALFFRVNSFTIEKVPSVVRPQLYNNLKHSGQFDELYALAETDPRARSAAENLMAGRFDLADEGSPLSWVMQSTGNYAAYIQESSGQLQIDARSGSFGTAAERTIRLNRESRLTLRMADAVPDNAGVQLAVICAGARAQTIAQIRLGPGETAGTAIVRADRCRFANLELSFAADPGRRDVLIRVASIALREI